MSGGVKLSVVIVNYNVKAYLHQCLHSVERALTSMSAEIIVVDNASSDGSVEELTDAFPSVRFIANKENLGFAKANNLAIREAKGEYVLLLNPDTVVGGEVLDECVTFMDSHPTAGAVGVRMLKADGGFAWESRRGVPTPFTAFCKMVGLCKLFPNSRLVGRYYMRYLDENEAARIDIVSGAYMMLRHSALDEIGLLDETFFMYGEDIDLSYRLLKAGYYNYYLPCSIVHYKGESTEKTSFRYVRNFYNAMLIFYDKHFARRRRWLSLFIRMAACGMGSLEFLFRQRKRLDIRPESERYRLLVVGSSGMCERVEELCAKHGLWCRTVPVNPYEEDVHALPLGCISQAKQENRFTHIVFDTGLFSYSDILTFIQREYLRRDGTRTELGLYSEETGRMVFASGVYEQ